MIPVLTKEQAYKLDKDTIESGHLSQEELMDNAGKTVAQFFCEKIDNPFNQEVVVVCGKGNNGGDGVIAHSYLKLYNVSSKIVFTEEKHGHSKLLKKYKISRNEYSIYSDKTKFDKYNWIIDGIFGIGLSRKIDNKYIQLFKSLNKNNNIISIDFASGIKVDTGKMHKQCIIPKFTVTMGFPKLGHYINDGLDCTENLTTIDIGFAKIQNNINLIEKDDVIKILKDFKVKKNIHKYSRGISNIIGGNLNYIGATLLACKSAIKTGSGYINSIFDYDLNNDEYCGDFYYSDKDIDYADKLCQSQSTESLFLTAPIFDILLYNGEFLETNKDLNNNSFLFGTGWDPTDRDENWGKKYIHGNFGWQPEIVKKLKVVFDGGILFDNLHKGLSSSNFFPHNSIFTPHLGELKRMFKIKMFDLNAINKIKDSLGHFEKKIIIVKTSSTFIINNKNVYIINNGPSLLATAGTGDVLSGILVSLLSQDYSTLEASILGTYLHAEAANYYMNNISKDGMTASGLIDCIPHAFNILRENE